MKHLGDITKIDGHKVPLVDIVVGGSPCQDLSVAGLRKGLQHSDLGDEETTRSGLFMEQIRIVKEMRDECRLRMRGADDIGRIIPRFMVWENVPGAFSSNKGQDFRAVLEETARIVDKDAIIPMPEGGRWTPSGCIVGDGWSIAWRVHDAQFWGVPQRRKRIALVADFGGSSAPEILFERKGLSGDITESGEQGQGVTVTSERNFDKAISFQERAGCEGGVRESLSNTNEQEPCQRLTTNQCLNSWDVQSKHIQPESGKAEALYSGECRGGGGESYVMCLNDQGGSQMYTTEDKTGTLRAQEHGHQLIVYGISAYESNAMKSGNPNSGIYEAETTRTLDNNGGNPACNQGGMAVVQAAGVDGYNQTMDIELAQPLRAADGGDSTPKVICLEGNGSRESHRGDGYKESEISYTLNTVEKHIVCVGNGQLAQARLSDKVGALNCMHDQQAVMVYGIDRASFNQGKNAQYDFSIEEEKAQTLVSRGPGGGTNPEIADTLCARDFKGIGRHDQGKCIIQNIGKPSE